MFTSIEEAVNDLINGKMIIVVDDEDRENEGDLLALAEKVTPEMINFMISHAKGLVCCPITKKRADELELEMMVRNNSDLYHTAFTVSVDHITNTTGISAGERADTIVALTKEDTKPGDFRRPGHIFPLIAKENGVIQRPGHTEAAVDFAKLCNAHPSGVICEIINDDGTMARIPELIKFANKYNLKMVTIAELIKYRKQNETLIF
jgi:3,4-dihydroxy 2-butanone 4-phosphate synthase/GTP cyclohydrolase II